MLNMDTEDDIAVEVTRWTFALLSFLDDGLGQKAI